MRTEKKRRKYFLVKIGSDVRCEMHAARALPQFLRQQPHKVEVLLGQTSDRCSNTHPSYI